MPIIHSTLYSVWVLTVVIKVISRETAGATSPEPTSNQVCEQYEVTNQITVPNQLLKGFENKHTNPLTHLPLTKQRFQENNGWQSTLQSSLQDNNKEPVIHRVNLFLNYHLLRIMHWKVSNALRPVRAIVPSMTTLKLFLNLFSVVTV